MESFFATLGWIALAAFAIAFISTIVFLVFGGKKLLKYGARLNREEAERELPAGAIPAVITQVLPYAERGYDQRMSVKAIINGIEDYVVMPTDAPNLPDELLWATGKKSAPAPAGYITTKDGEYYVLARPLNAYYHSTSIVFAPRVPAV